MNISESFETSINPSSLFIYAIIFCLCIVYFRNINITLGVLTGILLASVCIYILHKREIDNLTSADQLHKTKADNIIPSSKKIINYIDLTDFIFSIQDFYVYNPQSYENIIKSLDIFIDIYEDVLIDSSLAGDYYAIADAHKLLALNNLHSIIMMIPSNKLLIDKLNKSMEIFEQLLNKYLIVIYEKNNEYIKDNGYFNNSKIIELNISPYNKYDNKTFDQYY